MKILVNIVFLIIIIYNLMKRKHNLFKANIPKTSIIATLLLLVVGFVIWYINDKSILGVITLLSATVFFISFFSAIGINEKFFNSFMANSIVILSVPYSEISNITIKKKGNSLYLKIKAHGYEFLQQYNLELEKEIIKFISSRLKPSILRIEE
ncbi:hypothetical protein O6R05_06095 [Peptoniphilus equinus]|uniref:DUF5673 domain-containing protein n=1 Tax=Peptoniphilus equinus TaxID=3016343 RepID=A0ABY7QS00_9FIRM|nr:hypothetical protein [Peptoniphilus equinus]WBW49565.1 hypothetical protein O6R05_06095 [Peptoniphilus equinus]